MAIIKGYDIEVPEARRKLVLELQEDIRADKKHYREAFKQMQDDMELAWTGAVKAWPKKAYKVNITQRFVRQKVASLYAKNPRALAKRRQRMNFKVWDGQMQSLQLALQGVPDPMTAMAIIADAQQAKAQMELYDKLGKTMEICFHYYINEQIPTFKAQMKRCVRCAIQTAVGYVKLGFQRETDLSPDNKAKLADSQQRLAHIERLMDDLGPDGDKTQYDAEAEELRLAVQTLYAEPQVIIREGLVFDFPRPLSIIPDRKCQSLDGWIGADWVTEEVFMTPDEIKEFYKIDLGHYGEGAGTTPGDSYTAYSTEGLEYRQNPRNDLTGKRYDLVCVWMMYHKPTALKFELADGYKDFLKEPEAPEIRVERFYPIYALCFNELEHPTKLFPPSDVNNMTPQQMELNRQKEALREHRKANKPGYVTPKGALSEADKNALGSHDQSGVVELDGMVPGQKITDLIQALPKVGVDPNLYESQGIMDDVYKTVGLAEPSFGGSSGDTATAVATAEQARTAALEAEADQLNDFLTLLARDAGVVMLQELDPMTVQEIAGPGAVWPELNREQIAQELYLEIVAGSNGRPNKLQRQQALQQLVPFLIQIPGISPQWLGQKLIEAIDDSIDMTEAFVANIPSIQMLNNAPAPQPAAPGAEEPGAQGPEGANNAEKPDTQQQRTGLPLPPGQGGVGRPPLVSLPTARPAA
jgi:hypothetical protein